MILYKDEQITQKVPSKMVCDRCGLETSDRYGGGVGVGEIDMIEIRHEYGYGSKKDGEYIEFDLCEKCLDETINEMNIKVREYKNDLSENDGHKGK